LNSSPETAKVFGTTATRLGLVIIPHQKTSTRRRNG
jgi:hypothetical protein